MLDRLEEISRELSDAIATVEWLRAGRDRAIADAHDAGIPLVRIAEAAGLTRRAVYDSLARTSGDEDARRAT